MLLIKSFILGLSVSAPIGPVGLLCIQRILSKGKTAGFMTGLGASSANLFYASIAAFGFSIVSSFLIEQEFVLRIVGAIFLLYLGIKTFLKRPAKTASNLKGESMVSMFISTFLLMITNPVTILNFVAMFAGVGFDQSSTSIESTVSLIIGVFLGAVSWWFILSSVVSLFRNKIITHLGLVNKMAGLMIVVLGIISFIK
ncbi:MULTISPECIES: LysE family transporter [Bacillaceae]|uniref:Lysine transporter LysE n=1 Tax=Gottfriedia luciferensis TaxID=178774 RepID=A0ABX2ZPB2_9BACI|nr:MULTISPECIES: LysE family transporter [Bacillaceae]ODG90565.1 lysine transporter LysE [Gottfriedia luciferensis]SFD19854.1 Threonine/homoserine/homoserine lactone efflux protein [Bacillus sp. UNCCL81]